jgi:exonuclease SbcC
MNIKISHLILKNFKGTKSLVADFKGENAVIKGDNGTGKSTIVDAFSWILFGKNSAGVKTFNIKTLDKQNNVIHNLDHEVTAILLVDEKEVTLKKTYKETWTKKRGEAEKGLTGHTTDYFINEVPVKMAEYEKYINELVDEKIFKLITSPLEFNNLPWKERRNALMEIVGDVSDINVIESSDKLKKLSSLLGDRKLEDFKKIVSSKKKLLNDEIKSIPYRVDELVSSVDISGTDFAEKEKAIAALETEITNIDFQILDQSSMYKASNLINEKIHEIKNKLRVIETTEISNSNKPKQDMQKQLNDLDTLLSNKNSRIGSNERLAKISSARVSEIDNDLQKMREAYTKISENTLIFDENAFHCPTCKREFEQEHSEELKAEMVKNFDDDKSKKLKEISAKGKNLNLEKAEQNKLVDKYILENETLVAEAARNEIDINTLQTKIEDMKNYEFIKTDEYLALEKEIAMLEASIKEPNTEYLDSLKADKKVKEREIDSLKAEINQKAQFEKNQIRITELEDRKTELGIQIAELEGQEFLCETFIKTKVDMLEDKINSMFKNVNFRLFETQINEGLKECCDVLVNGVPYADVNTGGKINAGLDVLNTLCDYYNVYAPIFIDGRESITKIIDVKSQVINLKVVEGQKLTIEGVE